MSWYMKRKTRGHDADDLMRPIVELDESPENVRDRRRSGSARGDG